MNSGVHSDGDSVRDDPLRYFICEHIPRLLHLAPADSQPHRNAKC